MNTTQKITEYIDKCSQEGWRPTIRQIMREMGLRSTSTVSYHLRKAGYKHKVILSSLDKERIFDILGRKCSRCGFSDKRALQIDHKNGGGSKERKSIGQRQMYANILKCLENGSQEYQILCANCNWIKRHENKECIRNKKIDF